MYVAAPAGFQPNGSVFTPSHYQLPISQDEKCLAARGLRIEAAEQPLMAQLDVGNIIRSSPVSFGFGEHP
jgi:hypothetical protein